MDATYLNSNEFRVSGGRTDEFVVDRRLKLDCGVDGTKYCTVYSSTVSGSYTLVTTKESELTSNLSSVLYGIVQPGISGSLPDHSHDGSEGSGGLITAKGVQSIKVEYATTSGVYINPGVVHINDGTNDDYYQVSSQFTKSFSGLSVSTWYYLYAKPPSVGTEISANEIEYTTNSGITYVDRKGHYHTSNNDWRCIGAFYSDGSSNIEPFYTNIGMFRWSEDQIDDWNYDVDGFIGSSWQEVNIHAPYYCDFANVSYRATYNSVNSNQTWRKSSTAGTIRLGRVGDLYRTVSIDLDLPIENQKAQVRSESGDAYVWVYNRGHVIPDYIYTG